MNDLDSDLVRAFTHLQQPADRIACFLPLRKQFLGLLLDTTKQSMDEDSLCWRLLQLRKKRFLPSLHRESN
jgi:hypothetical protein